jgi:hypothetical protein
LHYCIGFFGLCYCTHLSKISCYATFFAYNIPGNSTISSIHIIAGPEKPLLGKKTATDLGLLHIGMLNTLDVNTDSIISSFKDRFTGLGKLKDFQLKLHIDESV